MPKIPDGFILVPADILGNPRLDWLNKKEAKEAPAWIPAKITYAGDTEQTNIPGIRKDPPK